MRLLNTRESSYASQSIYQEKKYLCVEYSLKSFDLNYLCLINLTKEITLKKYFFSIDKKNKYKGRDKVIYLKLTDSILPIRNPNLTL